MNTLAYRWLNGVRTVKVRIVECISMQKEQKNLMPLRLQPFTHGYKAGSISGRIGSVRLMHCFNFDAESPPVW